MFKLIVALIPIVLVFSCAETGKKDVSNAAKARMYVAAANGALNEGDMPGAFKFLNEAEKLEPDLAEIHHSRAIAFFTKRDFVSALQSARRAVELNPSYSAAQNTLGKLLLDSGRFSQAEKPLTLAANDPMYRNAHKAKTNLGILYYKKAKYSSAKNALSSAILDKPELACVAYYYRGKINLKSKHFENAIRDFENASRNLCGSYAQAHLAIGITHSRNKDFASARKKYLEVTKLFPDTKVASRALKRLRKLP